jgi:hypothetical protein
MREIERAYCWACSGGYLHCHCMAVHNALGGDIMIKPIKAQYLWEGKNRTQTVTNAEVQTILHSHKTFLLSSRVLMVRERDGSTSVIHPLENEGDGFLFVP